MKYWVDTLISMLIFLIVWILDVLVMMGFIISKGKMKWNTNKNRYPYFSYNFIKKMFLLGLKGAVDVIGIILTFIVNISAFLTLVFGIWSMASECIVVDYCYRIVIAVWFVCFLIKGVFISRISL